MAKSAWEWCCIQCMSLQHCWNLSRVTLFFSHSCSKWACPHVPDLSAGDFLLHWSPHMIFLLLLNPSTPVETITSADCNFKQFFFIHFTLDQCWVGRRYLCLLLVILPTYTTPTVIYGGHSCHRLCPGHTACMISLLNRIFFIILQIWVASGWNLIRGLSRLLRKTFILNISTVASLLLDYFVKLRLNLMANKWHGCCPQRCCPRLLGNLQSAYTAWQCRGWTIGWSSQCWAAWQSHQMTRQLCEAQWQHFISHSLAPWWRWRKTYFDKVIRLCWQKLHTKNEREF